MPLFENYEISKSMTSLSVEQYLHFKNIMVQKIAAINNNPLLNFDKIYEQCTISETETIIHHFEESLKLGITFIYYIDNIYCSMYAYITFDDNGDYKEIVCPRHRMISRQFIAMFNLFQTIYTGISVSYIPTDLNSNYVVELQDMFLFDHHFNMDLNTVYHFSDHIIQSQYYERYNKRSFIKLVVNSFKDTENECLYIGFINLLYSRNSDFLNSMVKETINFSSLKLFKKSRLIFNSLLESEHKQVLLDELKVYQMSTI